MKQEKFDYSFSLRRCKPKSASREVRKLFSNSSYLASILGEGLEFSDNSGSRRFRRRWTEEQFYEAITQFLSAGYRIGSIYKKPIPPPGVPQGENIFIEDLYEYSGLDFKLKKDKT